MASRANGSKLPFPSSAPTSPARASAHPSPLFDPNPSYTEKARTVKYSGTIILQLVIDAQGNVSDVRVLRPQPFGLAEQAIETARTWKFRPALRDGAPVRVTVTVTVSFNIS